MPPYYFIIHDRRYTGARAMTRHRVTVTASFGCCLLFPHASAMLCAHARDAGAQQTAAVYDNRKDATQAGCPEALRRIFRRLKLIRPPPPFRHQSAVMPLLFAHRRYCRCISRFSSVFADVWLRFSSHRFTPREDHAAIRPLTLPRRNGVVARRTMLSTRRPTTSVAPGAPPATPMRYMRRLRKHPRSY